MQDSHVGERKLPQTDGHVRESSLRTPNRCHDAVQPLVRQGVSIVELEADVKLRLVLGLVDFGHQLKRTTIDAHTLAVHCMRNGVELVLELGNPNAECLSKKRMACSVA
jgi:hypothetical protein